MLKLIEQLIVTTELLFQSQHLGLEFQPGSCGSVLWWQIKLARVEERMRASLKAEEEGANR